MTKREEKEAKGPKCGEVFGSEQCLGRWRSPQDNGPPQIGLHEECHQCPGYIRDHLPRREYDD